MHKVLKRAPIALLLFPLLIACSKKAAPVAAPAETAAPAAATTAPQAAATLDGSWEGESGHDLPVSFAVQENKVTSMSASYQGQKGSCSFNGSINSDGPVAVNGKTFTAHGKTKDAEFTATGNFASMTEASGTLAWKITSEICGDSEIQYKWTAKKSAESGGE